MISLLLTYPIAALADPPEDGDPMYVPLRNVFEYADGKVVWDVVYARIVVLPSK